MTYLYRDIWGEHGNPLQYSCLENPMNREAWRATVHRVAQSRTWLKRLNDSQRDIEGILLYALLFRAIKVSKYFWRFIFSSFPIIHPSSIPHLSPTWFHILFYPRLNFKPYPTPRAPEIVSVDTPFYQQNQKGFDWPADETPSAGQHVTSQGQPQRDLCNYATSSRITVTFKAPSTNSVLSIELKSPQPQWGRWGVSAAGEGCGELPHHRPRQEGLLSYAWTSESPHVTTQSCMSITSQWENNKPKSLKIYTPPQKKSNFTKEMWELLSSKIWWSGWPSTTWDHKYPLLGLTLFNVQGTSSLYHILNTALVEFSGWWRTVFIRESLSPLRWS